MCDNLIGMSIQTIEATEKKVERARRKERDELG